MNRRGVIDSHKIVRASIYKIPPNLPLPKGGNTPLWKSRNGSPIPVCSKIFNRSGFTLIEVVIGLAILGVGLMVIMELFAGGLRLGRVSEEYTKAVNLGRMKLEEVSLNPSGEEGVEEGEFNEAFRWKVETKKVDLLPFERDTDFKPPMELFHVKVDVIWKSGAQERSLGLESFRAIKLKGDGKKS